MVATALSGGLCQTRPLLKRKANQGCVAMQNGFAVLWLWYHALATTTKTKSKPRLCRYAKCRLWGVILLPWVLNEGDHYCVKKQSDVMSLCKMPPLRRHFVTLGSKRGRPPLCQKAIRCDVAMQNGSAVICPYTVHPLVPSMSKHPVQRKKRHPRAPLQQFYFNSTFPERKRMARSTASLESYQGSFS